MPLNINFVNKTDSVFGKRNPDNINTTKKYHDHAVLFANGRSVFPVKVFGCFE